MGVRPLLLIGPWQVSAARPPDWYLFVAHANGYLTVASRRASRCALLLGRVLSPAAYDGTRLWPGSRATIAVVAVGLVLLGNLAIITATAHLDVTRLMQSCRMGRVASLITWVVIIRLGLLARRRLSCATIVA